MGVPDIELSWSFHINQSISNTSTTLRATQDLCFALKNTLVELGGTVTGSSNNSTVGNNDGVDRWATYADIKKAGSWATISLPELGSDVSLLIDAVYGNDAYIQISLSTSGWGVAKGGSSNGTTTAAPTAAAATSWIIMPFGSTNMMSGGANLWTMHVMRATNGCTRVFTTDAGTIKSMFLVEKVKTPHASWTVPIMTSYMTWAGTFDPPTFSTVASYNKSKIGGTAIGLHMTGEGIHTGGNLAYCTTFPQSDDGSDWPMLPIGLACPTVGHRNWRKGQLYDMWWGHYNVSTGDPYPNIVGQKRKYMQLGSFIVPWNGITLVDGTAIDMS